MAKMLHFVGPEPPAFTWYESADGKRTVRVVQGDRVPIEDVAQRFVDQHTAQGTATIIDDPPAAPPAPAPRGREKKVEE